MLLIISRNKKLASALSETFYYMSYLSFPATPKEALSEISVGYKAAIIIEPDAFPDIKDYISRLKSLVKEIPIFAISDIGGENEDLFCEVFRKETSSPLIASKITDFCKKRGLEVIGNYKLAGFDASADRIGVSYFYSKPLFTKTEAMILRYLIASYPIPQSADKILHHAFRPYRAPEASGVRTHISAMNKKLYKISGRKQIELLPKEGYIIMTPEIMVNKKIM